MNDLRVAVVTGASSGIGAALVKKLSSIEFKVIMLSRDLNRMELVAEECESKYKPVPIVIDLRNSVSVEQAFKIIKQDFGCIDVLCAVAGVFLNETPISEQLDSDWIDVIETNLTGVMRCLRASWPLFRKGASIVTVGSVLGQMSQPEVGAYAASKAGINQLTRTSALELARHDISVNAISPGYIETDLNRDFLSGAAGGRIVKRVAQRRFGRPEDLKGVLLLLTTPAGSYMTGEVVTIDGGLSLSGM